MKRSFVKKSFLSAIDFPTFGIVILLIAIGLLNLYSATGRDLANRSHYFEMQITWIGLGVLTMGLVILLSHLTLERLTWPLYIAVLLLLVLVLIAGTKVYGARRWLDLGFIALQPSEFLKVSLVLLLAKYFGSDRPRDSYTLTQLGLPALMVGLPALLILLEPDLGTALITLLIAGTICAANRIQKRSLFILAAVVVLIIPIMWTFGLKDYQRDRMLTFLNPTSDPQGKGYHAIQSIIAVGSGRLFGHGYQKGAQVHLEFLPADHTDFVFSVFAEEWGFFAASAVLLLFLWLFYRGLTISKEAKDRYSAFLALGATALLFWHTAINIAMVIGLMPVVGVPLPFFSYGGSSMLTTWACVGLLLSVRLRKFAR
ncbi:MAG: rod shape-determining protein RodA [Deltaproteobacteria bacterium]|nr:rod shape-determining protein RodA [Deltaproteobacteria bacterium]